MLVNFTTRLTPLRRFSVGDFNAAAQAMKTEIVIFRPPKISNFRRNLQN